VSRYRVGTTRRRGWVMTGIFINYCGDDSQTAAADGQ
jgi:hypothetical protein